jgi:nitroreductase
VYSWLFFWATNASNGHEFYHPNIADQVTKVGSLNSVRLISRSEIHRTLLLTKLYFQKNSLSLSKIFKVMTDTIFNHRSIRKYKPDPIDGTILTKILEAGTRASTTGNMQVYSMVVTTDAGLKEQLWQSHFKQDMVLQAPVVITFCADFNRFNKWCHQRGAEPGYDNFLSFFTAAIDALLVAQNVAIAAEEFGLGICYLGTTTYMSPKIIEILQLPKFVVPVTTLVIGYPDESPGLTDRLPLDGVVHHETYSDYTEKDIDRIFAEKEALESNKELVKINQKETLAQIFTDNRYKKGDNEHFSKVFMDVISDQGFWE